jgi:transposase
MPLQSKVDRSQMQFFSLDEIVDVDSAVRVIDLFCKCIDYEKLGFIVKGKSHEGKPAFEAETLTAIYIYGYLNKIRSCRELEKACKINSELWWLTGMQKPGYKTIANFRKDNATAFKNLFDAFTKFCKELELFGRTTIAIDGSKFRAQNSKKNNYNLRKINKHLEYIDNQKQDYISDLQFNDELEAKMENLKGRKLKYENLKKKLEDSGDTQISTTDPDARALPLHIT